MKASEKKHSEYFSNIFQSFLFLFIKKNCFTGQVRTKDKKIVYNKYFI